MNAFVNFIKDENGLTAVEYVIAAALLAAALTGLFSGWGTKLQTALSSINVSGTTAP